MPLAASCPRCTAPVQGEGADFSCTVHGPTEPLWRPDVADYTSFAEMVARSGDLPTYLPWPMSPGWTIADFGCVGDAGRLRASVTTVVGTSDLDGEVEVTVVSEDPGTGLGARCARTAYDDPGPEVSSGPPSVHVRAGGHSVPLWLVTESLLEQPLTGMGPTGDEVLARAVFVGEAEGRWLWLVVRPGSAALLLHDEWLLADVTGFGPEALEMPFGGPRPAW
ncbi:MAG: hypothetical protein JWR20_1286 [Marmoricola sp.]|nr:hypothetical protein [Marmoricola sp.]